MNILKFQRSHKKPRARMGEIPIKRFIDGHCFLTKSNQVGVVLSVDGVDDECLTEEEITSCDSRAVQAWRGFDERFYLYQYVVKEDNVLIECKKNYPTEAIRRTVIRRRDHLEDKASGIYTIRIFYVVLVDQPKFSTRSLSSRMARESMVQKLEEFRGLLMASVVSFQRQLDDLVTPRILGKQDAFQFFRTLVNLDPDIAAAERLTQDSHVDYFLPTVRIKNPSDNDLRIGEAQVSVLSMRSAPRAFPNVLRDLLRIGCNFILCHQFRRVPNATAVAAIRSAQGLWKSAAKTPDWKAAVAQILARYTEDGKKKSDESVVEDESALQEVDDLSEITKRINNGGEYAGKFAFTAVMYGWNDRERISRASTDVIKVFGAHDGSMIPEDWNALSAYLSILPGNEILTEPRQRWIMSGDYANLSFIFAPYCGSKINQHVKDEYLLAVETEDATPYYFSQHEGEVQGTLIMGIPSSGKSVLTNAMIDHGQKYGGRTFILDIRDTYRVITEKHGGSYVRMRFTDSEQSCRINPLSLAGTRDNLQFISTFVQLLLSESGATLRAADEGDVFRTIESLYSPGVQPSFRTLGNLMTGLSPHLKQYLKPWCGSGQYGYVFDNAEDTLEIKPFQTFEFSGMGDYQRVMTPLLFYVFQRISSVVLDPALRSTTKQLYADEVWSFLKNDLARNAFIAAGKTWRAHNGGITLVTQSMDDLLKADALEIIKEVCPTKIFMGSPGADVGRYQAAFNMNEKVVEKFSSLRPGGQFLVLTNKRAKVLNLNLDNRSLWEYLSSPDKAAKRDEAIRQLGFEQGLEMVSAAN